VRAEHYYKTYGPVAYRRCVHLLADAKAARDATRDIFTKLLGEPDKFGGSAATVAAWVYRSATKHCFRLLRAPNVDSRPGGDPRGVLARRTSPGGTSGRSAPP
jgi:DNA-directed RNA polymerase specialized sigma24 family protein